MMTIAQIEYELDYWRQTAQTHDRLLNDRRQLRILELWGLQNTSLKRVLEIGTGPYLGCLPFVTAEEKTGVDILYPYYQFHGLMCTAITTFGVEPEYLSRWYQDNFDTILCMNTLDHGDSEFSMVDHVSKLLVPGGRFYLHVNLRTEAQLNEGHDHTLRESDLQAVVMKNGLRQLAYCLYPRDPVEDCDYATVVGVWEKI